MLKLRKPYTTKLFAVKKKLPYSSELLICEIESPKGIVIIDQTSWTKTINLETIEKELCFMVLGLMKLEDCIMYSVIIIQKNSNIYGSAIFIKGETLLEHLLKTEYYE